MFVLRTKLWEWLLSNKDAISKVKMMGRGKKKLAELMGQI